MTCVCGHSRTLHRLANHIYGACLRRCGCPLYRKES